MPPRTKRLRSGRGPRATGGKPSKRFADRRDDAYRAMIASLPCLLAGRHECYGAVECCHLRSRGAAGIDVGNCFPACRGAHDYQHTVGIKTFQRLYQLDLYAVAARLAEGWAA